MAARLAQARRRGPPVHQRCATPAAVKAAGVLGYLQMFDSTMLLLAGGDFGLFHVRGGQGQLVGLYDFGSVSGSSER